MTTERADLASVRYRQITVNEQPDTTADPQSVGPPADGQLSGSGLAAEKARRLGLVDAMRDAGGNPYPYRFDR